MSDLRYEECVSVPGKTILFQVANNYEFAFCLCTAPRDKDGWEGSPYERVPTSPEVALAIMRKLVKVATRYIYREKPPYILINSWGDRSRTKLYGRFAKMIVKAGYTLVTDETAPHLFYLYKNPKK